VFYSADLDAYVVTRHADCDRILRDTGEYVSASAALEPNVVPVPAAMERLGAAGFVPGPGEGVVDEDGELHRRHRQAIQPPFRPAPIAALEDFVRREVTVRLDTIVKAGEADMVDALFFEVPAATILHMLGVPDSEMGIIKHFRGPWAVFGWGLPSEEEQLTAAEGVGAFWQWARAQVERALEAPGDDIISVSIANLQDDNGAIDVDWMTRWTLNAVMAGHETTTNTCAAGLMALLGEPDQWQALTQDLAKVPNAVEEILRHSTGVPTWRQRALKDIDVDGVTIPAGAKIYVALCSAGRDERVFGDDSERFDLDRPDARKHIAFGSGRHTCLGNHMARLEMRVMFEELTTRLPHLQLVPGRRPSYSPNTSQRGPEQVMVTWDPTKNPIPADRP
jgi:cytochrome P450